MNRVRTAPAALLCLLGFALAAAGLWRLPGFGHYPGPYGDILNAVGTSERHGTNIVTLVNFDYRGFDTLGEEHMLFAAVIGAVVLLREHRGEETSARPGKVSDRPIPERADAIALGSRQGGAIIGSATLLLYLGLLWGLAPHDEQRRTRCRRGCGRCDPEYGGPGAAGRGAAAPGRGGG